MTDAAGRVLQFGYAANRLNSVTDYEGNVWTLSYGTDGHLQQVIDPLLDGQSYGTGFIHTNDGNVSSITNRLGATWSYAYAANNALAQHIDPANNQWGYRAAAYNMRDQYTATDDQTTSTSAQSANRSQAISSGPYDTSPVSQISWPDDVVGVGIHTDPTGAQTQHGFDGSGRITAVRGATDNRVVHAYDSGNNRVRTETDSGLVWQWSYDAQGNTQTSTDPLNQITQHTYDSDCRLTAITNPSGETTQYQYDSRGNRTATIDPTGGTTQHVHDSFGQVIAVVDPSGVRTQHTYDGYGNVLQTADALGNAVNFRYSGDRMTWRTDAMNRTTTYRYDAWGRQTGVGYPSSAPISYVYDAAGRLTLTGDGTGTRTFSYDSWGRKTGMTDPRGSTAASYDAAGRLQTQSDVSGRTYSYSYDGSTRLAAVGDGSHTVQYTYTPDNRVANAVYPNGTQVEYGYDGAGRTATITHRLISNGSVIAGYAGQFDGAGRLVKVTETPNGAVTTYQYDKAGRVTSEVRTGDRPYSGSYQYDSASRRTFAKRVENGIISHQGSYTYDSAGRLSQISDATDGKTYSYAWNADGTLASYPGPGYTRLLAYDEEGRVVRVSRDYGGGNTQIAYEYGYGADGGRRWQKNYDQSVMTWYPCGVSCCAGELVELQSDLSGNSWTTSAQQLRGSDLVSRNNEFHHFDLLGTAAVITGTDGSVISRRIYDAFGVERYSDGTAQSSGIAQAQSSRSAAQTPWQSQNVRREAEGTNRTAVSASLPAVAQPMQKGMCPAWGCHGPTPPPAPCKTRVCSGGISAALCMDACTVNAKMVALICKGFCTKIAGWTCTQLFDYCGVIPGNNTKTMCITVWGALCDPLA